MAKVHTILKENRDLKEKIDEMLRIVKENETKHNGFKTVQYSCLLSESLQDFSDRPLQYLEEIFNLDRAVLYIKEGSYFLAAGSGQQGERVFIKPADVFKYTFLEKRIYFGNNALILHKEMRFPDYEGKYSFVLAPVTEEGKITAAIALYSSDTNRFGNDCNFDFISELALVIGIALRKLNDSFMLEIQAQTDYLTGLPNKSMMEMLTQRWYEQERIEKVPFVFVMIDLDNFKQVNDINGHVIGDEVLRRAARAIRNCLGDDDILGRFGGDEFYMLLEIDDEERIAQIEKNILSSISGLCSELGLKENIGVSGGGVRIPEDKKREDESFFELVRLADERLYNVKKNGKGGFLGVTKNDNK